MDQDKAVHTFLVSALLYNTAPGRIHILLNPCCCSHCLPAPPKGAPARVDPVWSERVHGAGMCALLQDVVRQPHPTAPTCTMVALWKRSLIVASKVPSTLSLPPTPALPAATGKLSDKWCRSGCTGPTTGCTNRPSRRRAPSTPTPPPPPPPLLLLLPAVLPRCLCRVCV
jgi:hypothetical protein